MEKSQKNVNWRRWGGPTEVSKTCISCNHVIGAGMASKTPFLSGYKFFVSHYHLCNIFSAEPKMIRIFPCFRHFEFGKKKKKKIVRETVTKSYLLFLHVPSKHEVRWAQLLRRWFPAMWKSN